MWYNVTSGKGTLHAMNIRTEYKVSREGDVLLLMVPNYWAKGDTVKKVQTNLRKIAGSLTTTKYYVLYSAHPDTAVDPVNGGLSYPIGHAPIELASRTPAAPGGRA